MRSSRRPSLARIAPTACRPRQARQGRGACRTDSSAALAPGCESGEVSPLTTARLPPGPRATTAQPHTCSPTRRRCATRIAATLAAGLHKQGESTPAESTSLLAAQEAPGGARAPRAACRPAARACAGAARSPGCPGCSTRPAAAGGLRARAAAPPAPPPSCALRSTHSKVTMRLL